MSISLDPLHLPLWGSRLIEASAGTGKTWTIAALYIRLILGHGAEGAQPPCAWLPENILVMTFTRAATQELKERIRNRLQEAAVCFRSLQESPNDLFLTNLLAAYPDPQQRQQAAWRLSMAAETMDESAIFTIDAWCQRSLREHAFATGSDFRETLLTDETELLDDATRDFWRQEIYPLPEATFAVIAEWFQTPEAIRQKVAALLRIDTPLPQPTKALRDWLPAVLQQTISQSEAFKSRWAPHQQAFAHWLLALLNGPKADNPLNGTTVGIKMVTAARDALQNWLDTPEQIIPEHIDKCQKLTANNLRNSCKKARQITPHPAAEILENLLADLEKLGAERQRLTQEIQRHAAAWIQQRLQQLKARRHLVSFNDYQQRLAEVLRDPVQGSQLSARLREQYPVALIDEFQDTSALQYQIFDAIYQTHRNAPERLLLLIGDPKQSIYGFRGADIDSYLQARRLTQDRHYQLDRNFRSGTALVNTLNALYSAAEQGHPQGAFAYGESHTDHPLPYWEVLAQGQNRQWQIDGQAAPALTIWAATEGLTKTDYLRRAAERCAETIAQLLGHPQTGFAAPGQALLPLAGRDIAILVRNRHEAATIRSALQDRQLRSVYLSERESVYDSAEARDLLLWLEAVANPDDARRLRTALALPLLGLSHHDLEAFNREESAWENQLEQFQDLSRQWQRQGVLAMLHHSIHRFAIAAHLLRQSDGERRLTNLLQLGELLQQASATRDGPEALLRFLREAIAAGSDQSDAHILRLESDAALIRVATIHSAKGLQYPLVFLPFIATVKTAKPSDLQLRPEDNGTTAFAGDQPDLASAERRRLQEDLRLLYVALTRAEHALWMGLAEPEKGNSPIFKNSAIAYLLQAGNADADLSSMLQDCAKRIPEICIETLPETVSVTLPEPSAAPPHLPPAQYTATFEKNWGVSSFSQLIKDLARDARQTPPRALVGSAWHRYPQGMTAGTFLHAQLQELAQWGFRTLHNETTAAQITAACMRAGLEHWIEATHQWLQAIVNTPLTPFGGTLDQLQSYQSEMAFWFPSEQLPSEKLDQLCKAHIFLGVSRPSLPKRSIHGMMRGFMDLVFEEEGRYYVMDYKSNVLGRGDSDYDLTALRAATMQHRYELQSSLYQLALHRLLRQRLGTEYRPEAQLGGTLLFFLRGVQGPERGILHLPTDMALLDELDQLFAADGYRP